MKLFVYDGSFEGLLSLIFEAFDRKEFPDQIIRKQNYSAMMFDEPLEIKTSYEYGERVWRGLQKKISPESLSMIYRVYLSELPEADKLIVEYVHLVFSSKGSIETNFSNNIILQMTKIWQKVNREASRVPMFLRFGLTTDGIYYASYEPKYDVLSLVTSHFQKRFADQKWIIFDIKRQYGYYFDGKEMQRMTFEENMLNKKTGLPQNDVMSTDEDTYTTLWRAYFKSINIEERKNVRLQMQLMPKRFWKLLPEMNDLKT